MTNIKVQIEWNVFERQKVMYNKISVELFVWQVSEYIKIYKCDCWLHMSQQFRDNKLANKWNEQKKAQGTNI